MGHQAPGAGTDSPPLNVFSAFTLLLSPSNPFPCPKSFYGVGFRVESLGFRV